MRIRQIALAASRLDPVLDELGDVFALGEPFEDPGVGVFGLRNGVFAIGEHFLEVVSPKQDDTSAGRFLARRGDGGYMVIFQVADLASRRTELEGRGVRTVWEIALPDIETIHLHPRDTGGAIVSIDEARPWESWRWAGPGWQDRSLTGRVRGIAGVELQSDAPDELLARWSEIFGLSKAGANRLVAGEQWIDFVRAGDGRGEGIRSVALAATDPAAVLEAARRRGLAVEAGGTAAATGARGAVIAGGVRFVLC